MDMGTSNTRIWLCDKKHVIDLKKASFGAKLGKSEGKNILFERLRNLIREAFLTSLGFPKPTYCAAPLMRSPTD